MVGTHRCDQVRQVFRAMREVGIHLADIRIALVEREAEAEQVRRTEAQLARSLKEMDTAGIALLDILNQGAGFIGRVIVNN